MLEFATVVRRATALSALAMTTMVPIAVHAQAAGIDQDALALLRRMTDYMAALPRFSVETHNTLEAVLTSGQKLDFSATAKVTVQRPNKLRAERVGDLVSQVFYYDGKTLTLQNPTENFYASVAAPATLEATLDLARDQLDVAAPAGDLLYKDAFARLTQDVTSGFIVDQSAVGGVKCDHLAFSGPQVDFQIWIQAGDKPLPRRYVITTKDVAGLPVYSVVMSRWDLSPNVSGKLFSFTPPPGAKKIDFLRLTEGGAGAR